MEQYNKELQEVCLGHVLTKLHPVPLSAPIRTVYNLPVHTYSISFTSLLPFFHHGSCDASTISHSLKFVATPALAPLEVQVDTALLEQYNKELQEVCLGQVSTKTLKTPPCSHAHHT